MIVRRPLSATVVNDPDGSGTTRSIGFDLGPCDENVILTDGTSAPVLIDW
jgi:hypothetical protein